MRRLAPLLAVGLAAVLVLSSCSEGDPGAGGDVESLGGLVPAPLADELTESGRCDDGRLWAADEARSLVVTIDPGPDGPPAEATLPTDAVVVTLHHGGEDPCTVDPADGSPAAQGRVEIDRPGEECGPTAFRIDGLEADDGTAFGPIEGLGVEEGCIGG